MKLKLLLTTLIFIHINLLAYSQLIVKGKVTNAVNGQIPGATVELKNNRERKGGVTDAEGNFEISLDNAGAYKLEVRFLGYEPHISDYTFDKNETYNLGEIDLIVSDRELQTVEILGRAQQDYNSEYSFSATKIGIKNKELPQALSVVTKEIIRDRQAFQLTEAVKTVAGVTPSGFYNHYNIRGITQNEEGQIINGMRTHQYYFVQPITTNIERVEVLKGPASVSFSSVDPGGSINMVTKKPLIEDRKEVSFGVGSFSTLRGSLDFTGPLNKSKTLLYRLNVGVQKGKSYRDLINNDALLVSPSISYVPNDKTAINVEMIYSDIQGKLDRGQPIFGAVAGVTDLNSTPISLNLGAINDYFTSKDMILMANITHSFTDKLNFNASYMKQTWNEDLEEHRTTNAFAVDIDNNAIPSMAAMRYIKRQQFWDTDNLNAYFDYSFDIGKATNKVLVGYDLSRWHKTKGGGQNSARGYLLKDGTVTNSFNVSNAENYETIEVDGVIMPKPNVPHFDLSTASYSIKNIQDYVINSQFAIPSTLTTTHAVYIQDQFKIGKFSTLLSLRREWFEDITNFDATGEASFENTAIIPRVGLVYELTENINAYATYLEGYQPQSNTVSLMPSTTAYFWDTNSPARFKPLISDLKEVGAKSSFLDDKLNVTMAVYEINQKNILMNANLPEYPDSLVQRGADRSRGFELDLSGYILPNWQLMASYSYIDATIESDADASLIGERKENTPKHSANFWTRYNFTENSSLRNLGVGLGVLYSGEKIPWYSREFTVPGYTILDMAIYYQPAKTDLQMMLKVNNLFDKVYWQGAQTYLRLFPGAPRNLMLTTTYNF